MTKLKILPAATELPLASGGNAGTILTIGHDVPILYTRGLVLERTGATVRCSSPELALALLQVTSFDVVVLCHTLSRVEVKRICSQVHLAGTHTQLLLITSSALVSMPTGEVDLVVELERGPKKLQEGAARLLASTKDARQARPSPANPTVPGQACDAGPQALRP